MVQTGKAFAAFFEMTSQVVQVEVIATIFHHKQLQSPQTEIASPTKASL